MKIAEYILILCISGTIIVLGNSIGFDFSIMESIPGILILFGIVLTSVILHLMLPGSFKKFPIVGWITLVGVLVSMPASPVSEQVMEYTGRINLLTTATPVLAYAGISLGKDMGKLKKVGWKIAIVAIFVFAGTFLGSAIVAHTVLKIQGII